MREYHLPNYDPPESDTWERFHREFDLFGDDDEVSSSYSEPPVNRMPPVPPVYETVDGSTHGRSRDSSKWRCYQCGSNLFTWNTSSQKWTCMGCHSTDFYDSTQPRRHETAEGCWVYVPRTGSEQQQQQWATPQSPPSDGGISGAEWHDSESHTTDPVIDPDMMSSSSRRRRRRRGRVDNQPEAHERRATGQDDLGLSSANQSRIVDLLSQLVANQMRTDNSQGSWTSQRGPARGVRWRGGTPPSPPLWKNSADLRAFARWERKAEVWALQMKAFMPAADAALSLFTSLSGEAELETEHIDLEKVHSNDGIKYLVETLREPLQQKVLFQKRKLLSDYENISRYPNESVRQFAKRYVRVEKDLSALGISTTGMYDDEARGNRLLERSRLPLDLQRLVW